MDSFDLDSLKFKLAADEIARDGEFATIDIATGLLYAGAVSAGRRTLGVFQVRLPVTGASDNTTEVAVRNLRYVLAANSETNPVDRPYQTVYIEGPSTVGDSATGTSIAGTSLRVDSRGVIVKLTGF